VPALNRLILDATLAERGDLRYTPAGIPALDFTLRHESAQCEAEGQRQVVCELRGVALGDIALELDRHRTGAMLRCEGFLARRYRTGQTVTLHLIRILETKGH